ncbi:23S rRNA (pseudouridine(1915)-N(3))-methyltransferase RlmH [Mesoplasma melaleucae]|uniref:Ribosomal RNA large subunit methyltransferase H n=1 Tax=Mesoplasma melaleucae TaxID=81459 RepID=A0A2K8NZW9_9MOLU|nr:23S rRNA (pseudouridine(1915)-N(3))-methyltransferase RlmH [Mesoplasma melaleucae]ATZ18183.1 rRNA large subunit methyltransferase [Mesoplasma melaleucae]
MNIKIICFGKLDKKFFIESFNEYANRISKYVNFQVIQLKEEYQKEDIVNKNINSDLLIEKLKWFSDHEIICMDVNSKNYSTEEFTSIIETNKNLKQAKIVFIIGPSDGYSDKFLELNYKKVSFGNITLPHQLFRVILAEQIYRAFKIINNEKYHK